MVRHALSQCEGGAGYCSVPPAAAPWLFPGYSLATPWLLCSWKLAGLVGSRAVEGCGGSGRVMIAGAMRCDGNLPGEATTAGGALGGGEFFGQLRLVDLDICFHGADL